MNSYGLIYFGCGRRGITKYLSLEMMLDAAYLFATKNWPRLEEDITSLTVISTIEIIITPFHYE